MNWSGCGKKWSMPNLRYWTSVFLEYEGKPRSTSLRIAVLQTNLNPGSLEYRDVPPTDNKEGKLETKIWSGNEG
jgi:hypothetical protein